MISSFKLLTVVSITLIISIVISFVSYFLFADSFGLHFLTFITIFTNGSTVIISSNPLVFFIEIGVGLIEIVALITFILYARMLIFKKP